MNAFFKVFIAASVLAVASAGPVQNAKRQESSAPAPNDSVPSSEVPISVAPSTVTGPNDSVPSSEVPISVAPSTVTPSSGTPTTVAPNTSFTPFTATFASAFPQVTLIDQFMAAHPSDRTRSFTVATETATPTCNVLKCPISYSNGIPIYGGTSSIPVFPSPTGSA
ncbi:hypothetical protein NP233_g11758 [Leucocoprinus birnbaumii]|uniref:Uncharacterized protein n=1 Tax=Leucocoprinus birnbaumii TaxID=56174 RepID=A0AAD5VLL2_9AGAR|nr:hypothetical protein NP233_g11758 [Leucocoprinus birnbaumii]